MNSRYMNEVNLIREGRGEATFDCYASSRIYKNSHIIFEQNNIEIETFFPRVSRTTIEEPRTHEDEEKIGAARLHIIVVCPSLLEYVSVKPAQAASLSRQLASEKVLAMMLGVEDIQVTESHRAAMVSYNQWRKFFVKDKDEKFVGDLMRAAVGILKNSTLQTLKVDPTSFSVLPKKVKMVGERNYD